MLLLDVFAFLSAQEHMRVLPFMLSRDKLTMLLTASICVADCKSHFASLPRIISLWPDALYAPIPGNRSAPAQASNGENGDADTRKHDTMQGAQLIECALALAVQA